MADTGADFLLTVGVDAGLSVSEMQKGIESVVQTLNNNPQKIKVGLEIDSTAIADLKSQIAEISKAANGIVKTSVGVDGSTEARSTAEAMADVAKSAQSATEAVKATDAAMNKTSETTQSDNKLLKERNALLKQAYTLYTQIEKKQGWTAAKSGKSSGEYAKLDPLKNELQSLINNFSDNKEITSENNGAFRLKLSNVTEEVSAIDTAIKGANENTKSWADRIGSLSAKFGTWLSITQVIMTGVRAIKSMINNVVELDTAMTELKKVTDETDATYDKFLDNASSRAKKYGASMADTVTASADFARLGYGIEDAEKLADAAIVYKNVGDGIDDISTASESVIATMQAFGVTADDVMSIVDKFNEVGNNYAISSKGVGDALLRSASAMHAANNSLDETIALATAANTVVQDPAKVGTALKTVSMYLRAAKTEAEEAGESTEGMANSVSELRDEILALTGNKVDIQIDDNTFKSTYQILQELSGVWDDLTDISQANLLELIGGKRNSNVVAALLENFSVAENALETSANASGSALAENEKVLESLQGQLNILKATFEELSANIFSKDLLSGFISAGTALLNLLSKIAQFAQLPVINQLVKGSIFGGLTYAISQLKPIATILDTGIFKSIKNGTLVRGFSEIGKLIGDKGIIGGVASSWKTVKDGAFAAATAETTAGEAGAAAAAASGAAAQSMWAAWTLGISLLITAGVAAWQHFHKSAEEIKQEAEDIRNSYSDAAQSYTENIKSLNDFKIDFSNLSAGVDEYGRNVSLTTDQYERYKEIVSSVLDMSPSLIAGYDAEGNAIANKNNLLERAIELQEQAYQTALWETYDDEGLEGLYKDSWNDSKNWRNSLFAYDATNTPFDDWLHQREISLEDFVKNSEQYIKQYEDALTSPDFQGIPSDVPTDVMREDAKALLANYEEYQKANQQFIQDMQKIPLLSDDYNRLSDTQKVAVSNLINNLDILDVTSSDMAKSVRNQIIQFTDALSEQDENVFGIFTQMEALNSSFDNGEISIGQYNKKINALSSSQEVAISTMSNLLKENRDFAKAIGADINGDGIISDDEIEQTIDVKFVFNTQDVLQNLNKILKDSHRAEGLDLSSIFGAFNKSQINDISVMLDKAFDNVDDKGKTLQTLAKSIQTFDSMTDNGLSNILNDLDKANPESVAEYNKNIQDFFNTLRNNPDLSGLSDVIDVLEDILGNASASLEDFESQYTSFLSLAEDSGVGTGEQAVNKAVETLKNGLEEGRVNSNLFNEALDLLFGDNRPNDLVSALESIEKLFGTGEDSVEKLYKELGKYTENGVINLGKLRQELNLSDAAYNALTEKLRDDGLLLANRNDMNLIGDGLGISNDKVLGFEKEARDLVDDFKNGSKSVEEYNNAVDALVQKYGIASDAVIDFKRNMSAAATGKYMVADDEGFFGSMTAFLGVGGDVATQIEQEIKDAQDSLKAANFSPELVLDTDDLMNNIRQQLRNTGEYTEQQIEEMVTTLNSRVYDVRVSAAVSAHIDSMSEDSLKDFDDEAREQLKAAILKGFDSETGTFDIGKITASISQLDFVTNSANGLSTDIVMEKLGFTRNGDGTWGTGESGSLLAKLVMNLSTESASQNLQSVADKTKEIQDKLDDLQNNPRTINVNHDELASAEGQAISTRNTLVEMTQGYTIPVYYEEHNKPSAVGSTQSTNGTNEGGRQAAGGIAKKGTYLVNDGKKRGTELIQREDGTWGYVENNGLPGLIHLNDGDVVYNEDDTQKIQSNRYINLGKRLVLGRRPPSVGKTPSNSSSSSSSKSSSSSSSSSSSESKEAESEFERLYKYHQHLLNMEQESLESYLNWLVSAYKQAYEAGEIELDDFYKYEEEVYDKSKELFDDYLNDMSHQIEMLEHQGEGKGGNSNEIIAMYREMQEAVHQQADYYRSLGLDDNSDKIQELQKQWWEYADNIKDKIIGSYEDIIECSENLISLNQTWLDNAVADGDYEKVKEYSATIIDENKKMQEAVHQEAEYYRSLGYDENSDEIKELQKQWWEYQDAIVEAASSGFQALVDNANDALNEIQSVYSSLTDAAQEYADSGFITVDTLQGILDMGVEYLAMLKDENGQLVINEENIKKIIKARTQQVGIETALNYIQQLRTALSNNDEKTLSNLLDINEEYTESKWDLVYAELALLNLNEQQFKTAVKYIDTIRALTDDASNNVGELSDKVKNGLEDTADALDSILDYVIDMIKQEIENQIDDLEDEIDKYQEIVDLQKESLSTLKEQDNYNKSVSDKLKEISKLQAQINQLSLDDSREAQAEKKSLEEELAELQEDLADTQADHAYDATVDSLDKMAEAYEKEKNDEIDILNESISSYQKLYDLAIERIKSSGSGLLDELLLWNEEYGNDLDATIVEAWNNASEALAKYKYNYEQTLNAVKTSIDNSENGTSKVVGKTYSSDNGSSYYTTQAINGIVSKMKENSDAWRDSSDRGTLEEQNQQYGQQLKSLGLNAVFDDDTGTWYIDKIGGTLLYSVYPKYHQGGIVGNDSSPKDNEVISVLEKGELVLDQQKKNSLYEFIDVSAYMLERFGTAIDKIGSIISSSRLPAESNLDSLGKETASKLLSIKGNDSSYVIEKLEVTAPIQVSEKLDKSDIRRCAQTIGEISADYIQEGFVKRAVKSTTKRF